jgi:NAD(P)-dependent dehydrogenase (short-subunit alcohol dehydrogenase family)
LTDLNGKTALITGASRGIGAAIARMLHDRGCNLGLASRSGSDLGLERVVARPCDVRDLDALVELCDATAERFGGIDIVGRMRAWAHTGRSSTSRASTSTRCST